MIVLDCARVEHSGISIIFCFSDYVGNFWRFCYSCRTTWLFDHVSLLRDRFTLFWCIYYVKFPLRLREFIYFYSIQMLEYT